MVLGTKTKEEMFDEVMFARMRSTVKELTDEGMTKEDAIERMKNELWEKPIIFEDAPGEIHHIPAGEVERAFKKYKGQLGGTPSKNVSILIIVVSVVLTLVIAFVALNLNINEFLKFLLTIAILAVGISVIANQVENIRNKSIIN